MKLVIGGAPHSGKSVFREALKQALGRVSGFPYPYVITACPDGEGAWFQQAVANSPAAARGMKDKYKSKFTAGFARRIGDEVAAYSGPFCMIDIGGRVSDENRTICRAATDIVLLSSDIELFPLWEKFAEELGLNIVGLIHSSYTSREYDTFDGVQGGIFRGSIHYLERGVPCYERPAVRLFARHLKGIINERKQD